MSRWRGYSLHLFNGAILAACGLSVTQDWQAWLLIGWFVMATSLVRSGRV